MADYKLTLLKYPRGSVWKCRVQDAEAFKGVQTGNRPILIVSDNIGNYTNSSVVGVFITSHDEKSNKTVNVEFINDKGEHNVVLCNQVRTVGKEQLTEFMGMIPDHIMEQVENAITLAMGMKRPEANLEVLEKTVNSIINTYERQAIFKREQTDISQEQVNKIASQLEELFRDVVIPIERSRQVAPLLTAYSGGNSTEEPKQAEKKEEPKQAEKVKQQKVNTQSKKQAETTGKVKNKRKPNGFWTDETKKQFIEDKEKMTLEEMKVKWGMNSSKSVYQMYYLFRTSVTHGGKNSGGEKD